jgi:prolipoprotein diacylglyceryl transferase
VLSLLSIPSPPQGTWYLGPVPLRAYALCILAGIAVAWWMTTKRWVARGGRTETLEGILTWAVLAGIVGTRIYHVITDYQLYFGPGRDWYRIFFIWEGGLGIWGGVALGGLAAWWQAHKHGVRFSAVADAVAPGLVLAQAIGRLGNWFNQELYGRPTDLPWGLEIDAAHRLAGYENVATYHPTFLYELLWNVGVCLALLWAERRWSLGRGKLFTLYVVLYTLGRFWIEALRIDTVNHIGGFRLNNYTSAIVFVAALAVLAWLVRNRPGTNIPVESAEPVAAAVPAEPDETGDSTKA